MEHHQYIHKEFKLLFDYAGLSDLRQLFVRFVTFQGLANLKRSVPCSKETRNHHKFLVWKYFFDTTIRKILWKSKGGKDFQASVI